MPVPARPSVITTVLLLSVLGVSLSGPLVRLSDAHPIAIAAWRLIFALVFIAVPFAWHRSWKQWRALDARLAALAGVAGVMLALHFWSWNASIEMTTIAASVLLVNIQPLIVAILSAVWLKEAPSSRQWAGIAVAMLGAVVVIAPDLTAGGFAGRALLGDALAVVGAITVAFYYVIGRRLRSILSLWAYVGLVYASCLVTLLILAAAMAVPLGPYPPREYVIFLILALGPMLLGHTGLNWALGHARAYQVNIVLLGEPIGATVLAALIPGIQERPSAYLVAGGALVLFGIALAERRARA